MLIKNSEHLIVWEDLSEWDLEKEMFIHYRHRDIDLDLGWIEKRNA